MPTFENFKDLENYLKKNPKVVLEQNIGKIIEGECPVCKDKEEVKIISKDKGICLKCNREIDITITID